MLLTLSILGILLSSILLFFNVRENRTATYLALFFLLLSLFSFYQYVMLYSGSVILVGILLVNTGSLFYLIGPMLYWYVRSVIRDNPRLKRSDLWHLLPAAAYLVITIPYIFSSWEHKAEIAGRIVADIDFFEEYKATILASLFSVPVVFLSRHLLVLGYVICSVVLIWRFQKQKNRAQVFIHQRFMGRWLAVLLSLMFLLTVCHLLMLSESFSEKGTAVFYTLSTLQVLTGLGLALLMILPFFLPGILYGLPRLPAKTEPAAATEIKPVLPGDEKKYVFSLEAEYLRTVGEKADACMREFQPYLHPDLNLAQFSVLTGIPVHHMAYYLREVRKEPFSDYRNGWRILHAKNLLAEGRTREMTIEAIGLISGFSSRNAFLAAFRKVTGTSPKSFTAGNRI